MSHILKGAIGAGLLVFAANQGLAQDCGEISIAEMDWASAELMANVDSIILSEGYGCDVELVPGATTTTFASMSEKGQPDVAPELWINAVRDMLMAAQAEGTLVTLNDGPITDLGEGWWLTPEFAAKHPELDTVEKVLAHPELFPYAEDESKGAFVGCPAGWGCQLVNANLFRAFDMEAKGWVLVDPGSAAGLDGSMSKAVERSEPWFGYYWSPTSMIGKYNMVKLPFEAEWAGRDNWDGCIALAEQDCADPKPTSWTVSEVNTVVTDDFIGKAGPAQDYFKKRVFPGAIMNNMLVFMSENQATGEDAAYEFLATQEDVWTKWVPADVAAKVRDAL
ncbi:glycine betaine/proline transport system substrate-binding protein [Thalassovita litoralis]|jgi:glycine betaine/proline transport system substrate-binding protein|uniref:Glycine betaine/proline transport system substrate-binding protein n=1 Tax=Thalassovita litoralis TaxID=1010611 RepID=A0A521BL29_9RHOB|nr:glycine betaine ABC transporter substrate-binding protein [Thalassovita litoralis]SMO47813.1 glycine betaine/proline transport system substrate-binding protein [Thalassovita litoralis]